MRSAIADRIDRRRRLVMAHAEALVEAGERGDWDETRAAQLILLEDEMGFLVEVWRVLMHEEIRDGLPSVPVDR